MSELATLSEEEENVVQLHQLWDMTVDANKQILCLPVFEVTSAENSEKFVLAVEHPVLGEIHFFIDKPLTGWTDDEELVQLFEWYDIRDRNPYQLQLEHVYVQYTGGDPEMSSNWELVAPPREPTKLPSRPQRSHERMWILLFTGALVGSVAAMASNSIAQGLTLAMLLFIAFTAIGVTLLEP